MHHLDGGGSRQSRVIPATRGIKRKHYQCRSQPFSGRE
jgi:hypothetical protein